MKQKTIDEKSAENLQDVLENGPGLRYSRNTWIVAKDSKNGYVLKGGLGGLGVGQMWFKASDKDKQESEYLNAPEMDSTGGFGR